MCVPGGPDGGVRVSQSPDGPGEPRIDPPGLLRRAAIRYVPAGTEPTRRHAEIVPSAAWMVPVLPIAASVWAQVWCAIGNVVVASGTVELVFLGRCPASMPSAIAMTAIKTEPASWVFHVFIGRVSPLQRGSPAEVTAG